MLRNVMLFLLVIVNLSFGQLISTQINSVSLTGDTRVWIDYPPDPTDSSVNDDEDDNSYERSAGNGFSIQYKVKIEASSYGTTEALDFYRNGVTSNSNVLPYSTSSYLDEMYGVVHCGVYRAYDWVFPGSYTYTCEHGSIGMSITIQ